MKISRITVALVALALFTASQPVSAHHGAAAFDTAQTITVKGTVTNFVYLNPHVQLYFECKNAQGEPEKWQGELTAPNKLNRAGWNKNTLKPGDEITVSGNPGRNSPHTVWIRKLIGPDGNVLPLFEE